MYRGSGVEGGVFEVLDDGGKDLLAPVNISGVQSVGDAVMRPRSDGAAFAVFFHDRYGAVFAFTVRRIDDAETAREITADVFRLAWAQFASGVEPSTGWLLATARNLIGDAYRRAGREARLHHALQAEVLTHPAPAARDARVEQALSRLSAAQREVLQLTYWDGLSAAEVAEVVGVSAAAVWVRLHRARRAFAAAWPEET